MTALLVALLFSTNVAASAPTTPVPEDKPPEWVVKGIIPGRIAGVAAGDTDAQAVASALVAYAQAAGPKTLPKITSSMTEDQKTREITDVTTMTLDAMVGRIHVAVLMIDTTRGKAGRLEETDTILLEGNERRLEIKSLVVEDKGPKKTSTSKLEVSGSNSKFQDLLKAIDDAGLELKRHQAAGVVWIALLKR
jgi:hypothetical protein